MRAKDRKLIEFIGDQNDLIIPIYQRNYDWTIENCEKLFDDIEYIHKYKLEEYFMGAFTIESIGSNKLHVIDGQQRLTTISLLLLAIYNLGRDDKIKIDSFLHQTILYTHLVRKNNNSEYIKLKHVKKDKGAYEVLIKEENPELNKTHNIHKNYNVLKNRIQSFCGKRDQDVQTLYSVLEKIKIVEIELEPQDKPQLVFESINATGKKLSDVDLIRNFILMDKGSQEQKRIFETYWKPIEENTRFPNSKRGDKMEEKTTDFIWRFLSLEKGDKLDQKDVYEYFKEHVNSLKEKEDELELFLGKLKTYSTYYKQIAYGGGEHQKYYTVLRDILKQTTCYPYLLSLINHYENHQDTFHDDMDEILKFIINYYVKRLICGEPTNKYNDFFPKVAKKIKKYERENEVNYIDAFYCVFANDAPRLPEDEILFHKVKTPEDNFYKKQYYCRYILVELANEQTNEPVNMEKVTIEHIMPKTLNDKWIVMLGGKKEAEEIYKNHLNSLGNLTLTGYNSKISNNPFSKKLEYFNQSNISLNRYFRDKEIEVWNEKTIEDRTKHLAEQICQLLKPKVNLKGYKKENLIEYYHNLDECLSALQNKNRLKPINFMMDEKEYKVKNWRDILCKIADLCYKEGSQKMRGMIGDKLFFNNKLDKKKKYHEIAQDFYINVLHDATSTMKHVKTILTEYGLADDFKVKMRMVGKE